MRACFRAAGLAVLLGFISVGRNAGADATLLRDIGTRSSPFSAQSKQFALAGERLFFVADSRHEGQELWVTDASPEGAHLVRDIGIGAADAGISGLVAVGDEVYFTESTNFLWRSDGSFDGTVRVSPSIRYEPRRLKEFAGQLYFLRNHGSTSGLWTSDGTEAGTQEVKRIPNLLGIVDAGAFLYLFASDEVWISDGTSSGTVRIASATGMGGLGGHTLDDGVLHFVNVTGHGIHELWKSDGTAAGTSIVLPTPPGVDVFLIDSPQRLGDDIVFSGRTDSNPNSLWKTDGTPEGTSEIIADVGGEVVSLGSMAFFMGPDLGEGRELWVTDGTPAGTQMVLDIYPGSSSGLNNSGFPVQITALGDSVYFRATIRLGIEFELWKSDGTAAGTVPVFDGYPDQLEVIDDLLYFASGDPWATDGTPEGTLRVASVSVSVGSSGMREATRVSDIVYFAVGTDLWRTDGTPADTILVEEFDRTGQTAILSSFRNLDDELYFVSEQGSTRPELWTSDGTAGGTFALTDLGAGPQGQVETAPVPLAGGFVVGGRVAGQSGVWWANGIVGEALEVGQFSWPSGSNAELHGLGDVVLFGGDDGAGSGEELWRTDGTGAGTSIVEDILPGAGSSQPSGGVVFQDRLYFRADDGVAGSELWRSDGTVAGTELFLDVRAGPLSGSPHSLAVAGSRLFFSTTTGLWLTDGTQEGTWPVASFTAPSPVAVGERIFFARHDGAHGTELWVSNGTAEGSLLVRDIHPGIGSSLPGELVSVRGRLVFRSWTEEFGFELWTSDGTESGTRRIADVAPGPASSYPEAVVALDETLVFAAYDRAVGSEPRALDLGVCGDGIIGPLEECDDGNPVSGDGCSLTCDTDFMWSFAGVAEGGSIDLVVEGVSIAVATSAGTTAELVAGQVASAIRASDALDARGVAASSSGRSIVTDGEIDDLQVDDAGLAAHVGAQRTECGDGIDNDGDGLTDFPNDPGCATESALKEDPECSDGVDNDGDGLVDFPSDTGCFSPGNADESPVCSDGADNDGDTLVDHPADPGCIDAWGLSESACGLGFELAFLLPPLIWLRRRT